MNHTRQSTLAFAVSTSIAAILLLATAVTHAATGMFFYAQGSGAAHWTTTTSGTVTTVHIYYDAGVAPIETVALQDKTGTMKDWHLGPADLINPSGPNVWPNSRHAVYGTAPDTLVFDADPFEPGHGYYMAFNTYNDFTINEDYNLQLRGQGFVANSSAVPEPSSAALLSIFGTAALLRRKRSR